MCSLRSCPTTFAPVNGTSNPLWINTDLASPLSPKLLCSLTVPVDSLQRAACKVGLNASTGEHPSLHMGF